MLMNAAHEIRYRRLRRHHYKLMWMRSVGLSQYMCERPEMRDYVRSFQPRASFPAKITIHKLVETTDELQDERQQAKIKSLKIMFKGSQCIGLQLDMWSDTETQTAYAALNMTNVEEPKNDGPKAQLYLASECLAFEVFPLGAKTKETIRAWFRSVLTRKGLPAAIVSGIAPDGAADGQAALASDPELAELVDTCDLHILQRGILFSLGLAGATSKNPRAKTHLRKHNRLATLSRQSLAYTKSIKEAQVAAGVPLERVMVPQRTITTRWGNQFTQVSVDCTLRPAIDPSLEKYKRENKANKEAIVETNESDQGSKVGNAVAASELGLSNEDWMVSQEFEAFLNYPFNIKETIEHSGICTGAQSMALLFDLKANFCTSSTLRIKDFPLTLKLEDRERTFEMKDVDELDESIITARKVLASELQARKFDLRPSNIRLVQCFMSKQTPSSLYLTPDQQSLAKTCYTQMLRNAVKIAAVPLRASPPRAAKKARVDASCLLFAGGDVDATPGSPHSPAARHAQSDVAPVVAGAFDVVTDEMARWASLEKGAYAAFYNEKGLLNEFAMHWALRTRFPLHFVIFKQTASHLPHTRPMWSASFRALVISRL